MHCWPAQGCIASPGSGHPVAGPRLYRADLGLLRRLRFCASILACPSELPGYPAMRGSASCNEGRPCSEGQTRGGPCNNSQLTMQPDPGLPQAPSPGPFPRPYQSQFHQCRTYVARSLACCLPWDTGVLGHGGGGMEVLGHGYMGVWVVGPWGHASWNMGA